MNPFFLHLTKSGKLEPEEHLIEAYEHEHNTNEGSEFLDDAIRMKEQPLLFSEEDDIGGC